MTYFGVISQVNGKQEVVTTQLTNTAKSIGRTIASIHLDHQYAYTYQQCKVNPKLNYSLAATSMIDKQINSIHRKVYPEVIASKLFNRKWPRKSRHNYHQYCGINM